MSRQHTVSLVDPDPQTREVVGRLTMLMDVQCRLFGSGQEFFDGLEPDEPGCIIMDIRIPGINGLQIQQRLRGLGVLLPVIFLSAAPSVSIAVHAMREGALHFLEKPVRENDLWSVIEEALDLDRRRRDAESAHKVIHERIATLTDKEQAALELIADGLAKHVIAKELGVSVRTVEHYRTQLMRKLHTNSMAGLMQFALSRRNGHSRSELPGNYRLASAPR